MKTPCPATISGRGPVRCGRQLLNEHRRRVLSHQRARDDDPSLCRRLDADLFITHGVTGDHGNPCHRGPRPEHRVSDGRQLSGVAPRNAVTDDVGAESSLRLSAGSSLASARKALPEVLRPRQRTASDVHPESDPTPGGQPRMLLDPDGDPVLGAKRTWDPGDEDERDEEQDDGSPDRHLSLLGRGALLVAQHAAGRKASRGGGSRPGSWPAPPLRRTTAPRSQETPGRSGWGLLLFSGGHRSASAREVPWVACLAQTAVAH
jgi:hypothetical protein